MLKHYPKVGGRFWVSALAAISVAAVPGPALADSLYRAYNPETGEHLYTTHKEEVDHLQTQDWVWEKDQTAVLPKDGDPVWRLYNPSDGDHHYTTDANEKRVLTEERGWVLDFGGEPAFYSAPKDGNKPYYRIYDTLAGRFGHLFTADSNERNVWLAAGGWNDEGVAWYALWQEPPIVVNEAPSDDKVTPYHVHFLPNGGTGSMDDLVIDHRGFTVDFTECDYAREGYEFAGWNTKSDGSGDSYYYGIGSTDTPASTFGGDSLTLYAQWQPIDYSICYPDSALGYPDYDSAVYDQPVTLKTTDLPTKSGFVFDGWNTASDGSGTSYAAGQTVTNLASTRDAVVNLYPMWTLDPRYEYDPAKDSNSFDANDGEWTTPEDGALTAVLYDDGNNNYDLVFQYGTSVVPGRSVVTISTSSDEDSLPKMVNDNVTFGRAATSISSRCRVTPTSAYQYFNSFVRLEDISGLASWDLSQATNMDGMFGGCRKLANLTPLSAWDVSHVESMRGMFDGDVAIENLDPLASWRTSSATDMCWMFHGCTGIKSLQALAGWDVSNVTDMEHMFEGCDGITDASPLSGWNVSQVYDMGSMFYSCDNLASVDGLGQWNLASLREASDAFGYCGNLSNVNALESWNLPVYVNTDGMFTGIPATPPSWYEQG